MSVTDEHTSKIHHTEELPDANSTANIILPNVTSPREKKKCKREKKTVLYFQISAKNKIEANGRNCILAMRHEARAKRIASIQCLSFRNREWINN